MATMAPKKQTAGYPAEQSTAPAASSVDDITTQLANVALETPQETNPLTPANVHT